MGAGKLDHRAVFQRPVRQRDKDGQIVQGWNDVFPAWAAVRYLRGGEAVMQARMQSKGPVIVMIRNSAAARQITSEWRVVIRDRSGIERVCEVTEDPRPTPDSAMLEMLAEAS